MIRGPSVPFAIAVAIAVALPAQDGFRSPPEPIASLVQAPPPPRPSLSPQGGWLVLVTSEAMPRIDVVARPKLQLAGMRLDAATGGPQLGARTMGIVLRALADGAEHRVDVPEGHWSQPIWSADDRAFALLHTVDDGVELWLADPATATPKQVPDVRVVGALGDAVTWAPDQRHLIVKRRHDPWPLAATHVPSGPRIQESRPGMKAQVRTYQDLLQDPVDEELFERAARCQLTSVDAATRTAQDLGRPGLYARVDPSPDGTVLLVTEVHRPFSFVVPWTSFPVTTSLWAQDGAVRRVLHSAPLQLAVPIGGVPEGPRGIAWLGNRPHSLCWTEALDGGDPRREAAQRDRVMLLPDVDAEPVAWFTTAERCQRISACGGGLAMVGENDRKQRRERVQVFDPREPARPGRQLYERSSLDAYGDPGRPLGEVLRAGSFVLRERAGSLFFSGAGASEKGNRPFVDAVALATGERRRVFECAEGRYETPVGFVDDDHLLIQSESPTESPSLVLVDLPADTRTTLMRFEDPAAAATRGIEKRLLRYTREDGVPLSGTLYLPPGRKEGELLPALIWAYPLEYVQQSDAGQVRASPTRYVRMSGPSHLWLLLHGYAVFDDAAMPIVGPSRGANDTFVQQVQQNARAAVKVLADTGLVDARRLAVAGHSYGAFMTANLLAHTDLFAAGIARSGAYNRTLTPFGFQNEERTFWEAEEVYAAMSPFFHAPAIRAPLLMIHGTDDDNSGTFPMQSERLYAAIAGHGGTVRLCMLPAEAHGYRARENVLQCLAEMCDWLDRYCKERPASGDK